MFGTLILARLWPFLLRVAIGVYFIYPHFTPFLDGFISGISTMDQGIYRCVEGYMPIEIAFAIYHGFYVLLGLAILTLLRSVFPLMIALAVIGVSLYVDFTQHGYSLQTLLLFILMLVTLSTVLYTSNARFND